VRVIDSKNSPRLLLWTRQYSRASRTQSVANDPRSPQPQHTRVVRGGFHDLLQICPAGMRGFFFDKFPDAANRLRRSPATRCARVYEIHKWVWRVPRQYDVTAQLMTIA